jgi:hypothetical protein
MQISRNWATPLTIGAFILMAVTGILMFFHLDTGLNKEAHEWLGWAMVAGVAAHVAANWSAFARHFSRPSGIAFVGLFVLMLTASFFIQSDEEGGGNPGRRAQEAVVKAPLSQIAPLAGQSPQALVEALRTAGFKVESAEQTLESITGPEHDAHFKAFAAIFH